MVEKLTFSEALALVAEAVLKFTLQPETITILEHLGEKQVSFRFKIRDAEPALHTQLALPREMPVWALVDFVNLWLEQEMES